LARLSALIADTMQREKLLLDHRLHRHRHDPPAAHRLEQRLRVGPVCLVLLEG
jgi:hypothetical protein